MNVVSNNHLQFDNELRVKNGQKGSTMLELVDWWRKGSSNKTCLNVLREKDIK